MANLKLVEKIIIVPKTPTNRRRVFLSNIDLSLVAYQESVSFFDPPEISFSEACDKLFKGLEILLVHYDFFAGRLVPSLEDGQRLEIDCNGAGIVVAAATTDTKLSQLGELVRPKPEFKQLVEFLFEENEDQLEMKDMPLLFLQLTQLGCGGVALASRYNHCVIDGVAVREFEANMAALSKCEQLVIMPNPDRTIFKARNPPIVNHPHHEYSKPINTSTTTTEQTSLPVQTHLIYISPHHMAAMKKAALRAGDLKSSSIFQVVAAKIWKARSLAMEMGDERISTMLFPVDARKKMVPPAPVGFAGNALIPGFARASVRELKEEEDYVLVKKVQEALERLDDDYVRSSIDWLEVNKGVPCREDSFSLVAWWKLGLEEEEFIWGKTKCTAPIFVKPGLVYLLPGPKEEGGLYICLDLPDDQGKEFQRLMTEN